MSVDALNAAVAQLSTDVQALIAQEQATSAGSVPQAQVDAVTATVTALDATVKAALTPAPAPVVPPAA